MSTFGGRIQPVSAQAGAAQLFTPIGIVYNVSTRIGRIPSWSISMRWYSITLFATSLASVLVAASAQAQVARTFVSTAGSDSNNCANVATPCRHFQTAVNATALGGDVVALDPGNYGSITVTRGITIDGQGWA